MLKSPKKVSAPKIIKFSCNSKLVSSCYANVDNTDAVSIHRVLVVYFHVDYGCSSHYI